MASHSIVMTTVHLEERWVSPGVCLFQFRIWGLAAVVLLESKPNGVGAMWASHNHHFVQFQTTEVDVFDTHWVPFQSEFLYVRIACFPTRVSYAAEFG